MKQRNKFFSKVLFFLVIPFMFISATWIDQAQSQEKYPSRAIDIIVPMAPGGAADLSCRVAATFLKKKWNIPINMVNKPGGNTVPACLDVFNAAPDGYTLLAVSPPSSSMLPNVVRKLPFKIMDQTFIGMTSVAPMVLIVPASSPIKSFNDLVNEAQKNAENFTWTSLGGAGGQDFSIRQFLRAIGVDVLKTKPVMSQGGAQAVILTAGGHVTMGSGTAISATPAIRAGTVRPLAVTSKDRHPDLPDVPSTSELGYPMINYLNWSGISGPPNLPPYIVKIWESNQQEMLKNVEIISLLKKIGAMPFYHNARETREYVMRETEEVFKLWGLK
jgi:tripartite-type tricarboxylate transporter receptor subunit TctC